MTRLFVCVCVLAAAGVADAKPAMLKGPYLQDLAPTSITVMWELESPEPATLTVEGPGGKRSQQVSAERIAEATIDGLQPSSRYRYKVDVGGETWSGEFATAPPEGKDVPFSFIVVGDSRGGIDQHRRVVNRMAQEVPDFVLGTGDMVDEGFRQDQWQQFFDVENKFLRDNVYFPALGNHDRQGRGRTADSYRAFFSVPENGNETERYYAFTYASARFLVLDSNAYSFALTDQTAWLERELIAARQDPGIRHIFVVMHHPPFSISLHGGNTELRERWTPLFEQYAVTAVFSGHDHVYSRADHNGLHYFISGGGGAALYPRRPRPNPVDIEAVKKFERVLHYLRVTVTGNRVEVTALRADGTTIETTSWTDGPATLPGSEAPKLAAAGAPAPVASAAPAKMNAKAATPSEGSNRLMWFGLGGLVLALGAAVFVVRSLR
ncbi:MAG: metallophosphoesterase family protein [Kofleriaceae bacterium]|nr:metallophosphoesterase family protein [Kofleriaceae bacterium]